MEREVGGGIGMGNTCKPIAVSFQCMTKFTTNKKKKILNLMYNNITKWKFCKLSNEENNGKNVKICLDNQCNYSCTKSIC